MKKKILINDQHLFEKNFFHSKGTYIHPTSIIGPNIELDENVKIGPYSTLVGNVYIGANTRLHGYVSIGMPAQDIEAIEPIGTVKIEKNCEIREFVTISSPKIESSKTYIGNNCYIMNFSHIAHDVFIEDNVILINNVNLGGHVHIEHNSMLMANSAIHQFCRVGAYSALTPFSGIRQDLPPFSLFDGRPARFFGLNSIALRRAKIQSKDINSIKKITNLFFKDKFLLDKIEDIVAKDEELEKCKYVKSFINFVKNSSRGISRKTCLSE